MGTTLSTFENIKIWSKDSDPDVDPEPEPEPQPEPEPSPIPIDPVEPLEVYYFESKCGKRMDQSLCDGECDCHMSWPAGDKNKRRSPDAACRCLPKQMAPQAYTYKKECRKNTWGACDGCDNCKFSWPQFDTKRWKSAEKMCRCEPDNTSWTYTTESCPNLYDGECGADCHECVKAVSDSTGETTCRCAKGQVRQVIWGKLLADRADAGLCGDSCSECRWSWEESDALGSLGTTANYRCKN